MVVKVEVGNSFTNSEHNLDMIHPEWFVMGRQYKSCLDRVLDFSSIHLGLSELAEIIVVDFSDPWRQEANKVDPDSSARRLIEIMVRQY
jgi:hypothetical protein